MLNFTFSQYPPKHSDDAPLRTGCRNIPCVTSSDFQYKEPWSK